MTLGELELAVGIQPGDISAVKLRRSLPTRLQCVCGPIMEVVEGNTTMFAHFSARVLVANIMGS